MSIRNAKLRYLTALGAVAMPMLASANEGSGLALEEVVVTAQKRTQSLQDVPVSVAAISAEVLKETGDFEFDEFATRIPNLSFGAKGGGDGRGGRNIAIRGISGVNTTAYYIDEIPLPESFDLKLIDVSRIEVLRGPQGTLYGASSMGGAVKVITNKPDTSEFTLETMVSVASVDKGGIDHHVETVINIPLAEDTSAIRLAAFYDFQSGVFDRIVTGPSNPGKTKDVDDESSYGMHASLLFMPTDNLTIAPKIMFQRTESDGFPWADVRPGNFDQLRGVGIDEPYDEKLLSASLSIEYDLDWAIFVSATSYVKQETQDTEDFSDFISFPPIFGLTSPFPGVIVSDGIFEKTVQEFRLSSQLDGPLQFVAGAYFSKEREPRHRETFSPGFENAVAIAGGAPPGTPIFPAGDLVFLSDVKTEIDEKAVFGEVSYDLTENLTATLGLRWYESDFTEVGFSDGLVPGGFTPGGGEVTEDGINPKANITYRLNEDVMIFANAAKGFRLGGVNPRGITNFCPADLAALGLTSAPENYGEDELWSYEFGSKSTLADGRVRLNGSVFYTQWDELQQSIRLDCGFGFIENVGKAVSKGFEIDLESVITESLEVTAGIGYVNAEITDPGFNRSASKGSRVQEVPEWTFSASATYTWALENGNNLRLRGDYSGATESYTTFDENDPLRTRKKFNKFDLKLSYEMSKWTISAFVDNVSNERINYSDGVSAAAETPGRPRIATNRPRTVGMSIRGNIF